MSTENKVYIYENCIELDWMKIIPGDIVVLKPNLVKESTYENKNSWKHVITSEYVISEEANYVAKELKGKGEIYLCDAPQTDSSFELISKRLNFNKIKNNIESKYNIKFHILDLRDFYWKVEDEVVIDRTDLRGDPNGKIIFDLKHLSHFYKHKGEGKYYGADYDQKAINSHHHGEKHEYLICATPIIADVFINLPKLKTHKKVGVTLNLKNLVGINADKNWLPHHTDGSPKTGGDQFPDASFKNTIESQLSKIVKKFALKVPYFGPVLSKRFRKLGKKVFGDGRKVIRSGNWYGNDTTWRMAVDLNRCLLYGRKDGTYNTKKKRFFSIVDGILGMEGDGPMHGTKKDCGIIICGVDPVAVDAVSTTMMGFNWEKIPMIKNSFKTHKLPLTNLNPDQIEIVSNNKEWSGSLKSLQKAKKFEFKPHFGWKDHIEL